MLVQRLVIFLHVDSSKLKKRAGQINDFIGKANQGIPGISNLRAKIS